MSDSQEYFSTPRPSVLKRKLGLESDPVEERVKRYSEILIRLRDIKTETKKLEYEKAQLELEVPICRVIQASMTVPGQRGCIPPTFGVLAKEFNTVAGYTPNQLASNWMDNVLAAPSPAVKKVKTMTEKQKERKRKENQKRREKLKEKKLAEKASSSKITAVSGSQEFEEVSIETD